MADEGHPLPSAVDVGVGDLAVAVVGGPAFVRQLVLHVLHDAGFHVTASDPRVTVLVESSHGCFAEARALGAPIVVLTADPSEPTTVVDAIVRGADAVVHADIEPGRLVEVLGAVRAGRVVLDAAATRAVVEALRASLAATLDVRDNLTRRERQILESIDRGESVKQTSRHLAISSKTVENLQSRLFKKLGARNRAQAVALAHDLGLLAPGHQEEVGRGCLHPGSAGAVLAHEPGI